MKHTGRNGLRGCALGCGVLLLVPVVVVAVVSVRTAARQRDAWTAADTDGDLLGRLEDEIAAMTEDPRRILWQDAHPEAIERSLAPFRDDLDSVFCRATAGIDMDRSSRRAIWIALY